MTDDQIRRIIDHVNHCHRCHKAMKEQDSVLAMCNYGKSLWSPDSDIGNVVQNPKYGQ